METKNIFQKIQSVANEIKNIEKKLVVGEGKNAYNAVGDQDVTLAVKEAESKHGIVSVPFKQELVKSEILRVANKGIETIKYVDIVKMTTRIYNIDNPSEYIDIETFGRGLDSGDKGFGKASTYARKYALLNAYKIATGEDPDTEKSKEEKSETPLSEKRAIIYNLLYKNSTYYQAALKMFGRESIDELTDSEIDTLYASAKKKGTI
ncbi:ERF family protein [Barnesiella intestinihominis]|uniref:ERF family protein n=1 Tax=Barnesiella intestinihominis TaxID=487174 RepID=UPI003AB23EA8